MNKPKRNYYKKKLISITEKMETDMQSFRRDNGIKSESELIRKAISKYIYTDYKDATLNRHIMKQIQDMFSRCQVSVSFNQGMN